MVPVVTLPLHGGVVKCSELAMSTELRWVLSPEFAIFRFKAQRISTFPPIL